MPTKTQTSITVYFSPIMQMVSMLTGRISQICAALHPVCHLLAAGLLFPSIAVLSQCAEGLRVLGSELLGGADTDGGTGGSLGNE